jgi:hypothetical protein
MFLAWTITAAIFENSGRTNMRAGYPQVAWVWLFSFFYALAWSGLLVAYTLEILPYKLRAKGLMVMNLTVQSVLVLGKYVVPLFALFPCSCGKPENSLGYTYSYTNPIAWENLPRNWHRAVLYGTSKPSHSIFSSLPRKTY